jgi:hypothetical protein
LVFLSSYFAHDARSQEPTAWEREGMRNLKEGNEWEENNMSECRKERNRGIKDEIKNEIKKHVLRPIRNGKKLPLLAA